MNDNMMIRGIDPELRVKFKSICVLKQKPIKKIIEELMNNYIKKIEHELKG